MPKLEVTVKGKSEVDEPRLRVEIEASPEEIAVATTVGQRVLGRLRGLLRLKGPFKGVKCGLASIRRWG